MPSTPILKVNNLSLYLPVDGGDKQILENVSFAVKKNSICTILGESGSGKSMTALSIMRLLPRGSLVSKDSSIIFNNNCLLSYSEKDMRKVRRNDIGFIFQNPMSAFNPVMTIRQQLYEKLRYFHSSSLEQHAIRMLNDVQIDRPQSKLDFYPHEFSGGMLQRVMIALALVSKPKLLIADEPTTSLDVTIQLDVIKLIKR